MNGAEHTDLPMEETLPADRASADQTCAAISAKEMPSAMTAKTDAKTAGSAHDGEETIPPSESEEASPASARSYRIVGEVFYSYVIVEKGDRMLLIDKHAAHERVLFEELKARLHATEQASQLLMLPVEVMLMSDEVAVLEEYRPEL